MKVPLSTAAAGPLVDSPVPITTTSPLDSRLRTAPVATRDQGSCEPIRAQPMPSRSRCLARSTTSDGTSSSVRSATQVASLPVGPSGSVAALGCTAVIVGPPSVLYACYIFITNTDRCGKGSVKALVLMRETSGVAGPVTAGAGVPLHRQLFLVLHDEIARGALAPGDALPTEQALCDQFGVSRITVRRALADLAGRGYIERRQGVGSFVSRRAVSDGVPATGSYMDGLRQTQFQ